MTLGEILILVFVTIAFTFGIWGGLKLYKWNAKDRAILEEKNKNKKTK
jgi:hypothetical protein